MKNRHEGGLSLCIQGTCLLDTLIVLTSAVYPCAYREHCVSSIRKCWCFGLSLCIQGTFRFSEYYCLFTAVYPCAYREHAKILLAD